MVWGQSGACSCDNITSTGERAHGLCLCGRDGEQAVAKCRKQIKVVRVFVPPSR